MGMVAIRGGSTSTLEHPEGEMVLPDVMLCVALSERHCIELEGRAGVPAADRALEQDAEVITISVALRRQGSRAGPEAEPCKLMPHGCRDGIGLGAFKGDTWALGQ